MTMWTPKQIIATVQCGSACDSSAVMLEKTCGTVNYTVRHLTANAVRARLTTCASYSSSTLKPSALNALIYCI